MQTRAGKSEKGKKGRNALRSKTLVIGPAAEDEG
jgi:hypothetical protein